MAIKNEYILEFKSKGTRKTKTDVDKLGNSQKKLGKSAEKLKAGIAVAGVAILALGKHAVSTASQFEQLRTRLNTMYGSVTAGTKAFQEFQKVAATTPFAVKSVVEAGASLKAFGVDAEKNIKGVADLAAFMGVDVVEAASAMGRAFAGGAGAADMLRDRGVLQLIKSFKGIEDLSKLTLPEFRQALEEALIDPTLGIAGATDALSETFEGSYSNMMDSVDKLSASMGDKLLPMMKEATGFFKDLADELAGNRTVYDEQVDSIKQQQTELRILNSTLQNAELGSRLYKDTLDQLKRTYPDVLKGLETHEINQTNINDAIGTNIGLMEDKIELLKAEAIVEATRDTQIQTQKDLFAAIKNTANALSNTEGVMNKVYYQVLNSIDGYDSTSEAFNTMNSAMGDLNRASIKFREDGDLDAYFISTKKASEDFIQSLGDVSDEALWSFFGQLDWADIELNMLELERQMGAVDESFIALGSSTTSYDAIMAMLSEKLKEAKTDVETLKNEMGGLTPVVEKTKTPFQLLGIGIKKQLGNASEFMGEWGPSITGAIGAIGATSAGSHEEGLKVQKAVLLANVAQGIVSVLASEGWGIKDIAKKALLTATLVAQGSTQSKAIDKQISEIQSAKSNMQGAKGGFAAQYGMSEILDQPTTILAGEAGAELVNITPLEGPNLAGPQGGISVNITGNVMTRDYVREELAEEIKEAIRQGYDFR